MALPTLQRLCPLPHRQTCSTAHWNIAGWKRHASSDASSYLQLVPPGWQAELDEDDVEAFADGGGVPPQELSLLVKRAGALSTCGVCTVLPDCHSVLVDEEAFVTRFGRKSEILLLAGRYTLFSSYKLPLCGDCTCGPNPLVLGLTGNSTCGHASLRAPAKPGMSAAMVSACITLTTLAC